MKIHGLRGEKERKKKWEKDNGIANHPSSPKSGENKLYSVVCEHEFAVS